MSSNSLKNYVAHKVFTCKSYVKQDLALSNPQELMCHKIPTNKPNNRFSFSVG